ncbi:MAG: hypothetical protein V1676_01990 [Candidatus Diapherotrites archaeon]
MPIEDFEAAERLAQKSLLTKKDAERLASKVNRAAGKHAKACMK